MKTSIAAGFRNAPADSGRLVDYLNAATAMERVHAGKAHRAAYLAERARSVADLGCGTGDMIALFAADARWSRIVGVDHNFDLLDRAAARCSDPRVEALRADAAALPFSEGEFDAVLIERTLQHVEDPARVVAEAVRIAAPGGIVLVVEPDWSTLGVVGADDPVVTDAVCDAVATLIRHPFIGRGLRGLLNRAGLVDVHVDAEFHETPDLGVARFLALLDEGLDAARVTGSVSEDALDAWRQSLAAASATGDFSASLALFVAVGRVPAR